MPCRRLGTGGEGEGTQGRHVRSQLKLRDGNAGDRAQNIQGPVNMIDLCHALHLHRGTVETIYSRIQLTSDHTSLEVCSRIAGCRVSMRSREEDEIGSSSASRSRVAAHRIKEEPELPPHRQLI